MEKKKLFSALASLLGAGAGLYWCLYLRLTDSFYSVYVAVTILGFGCWLLRLRTHRKAAGLTLVFALLLSFLYSNMGTYDSSSGYIYKVKPFALFVRFPMLFSELTMPRGALWNVCFACVLSAVLLAASVVLWERRRGG